jgi:hypothetical protein
VNDVNQTIAPVLDKKLKKNDGGVDESCYPRPVKMQAGPAEKKDGHVETGLFNNEIKELRGEINYCSTF